MSIYRQQVNIAIYRDVADISAMFVTLLQTVRKRDGNKGKKKGSKTKLEKRAKLRTKL